MKKLSVQQLLLFVAGTCVSASPPPGYASGWQVGQEVSTTSGRVKGHAATWAGNEEVSEYLGIPYATPPLGALRFVEQLICVRCECLLG